MATGIIAGLVIAVTAGCTADATTPEPAPSTTVPSPTVTAAPGPELTTDQVEERYKAWFLLTGDLPTLPTQELDEAAIGAGVIEPGSPAEQQLAAELAHIAEQGFALRGDILVEVTDIEKVSLSGREQRATVCASAAVQPTAPETGERLDTAFDLPDSWVAADITLVYDADEGWLVRRVESSQPCVPPSMIDAVEANWRQYTDAHEAWAARGAPPDELGEIEALATGPRLDAHRRGITAIGGSGDDLQLYDATRTSVRGEWCRDDGDYFERATWIRLDGGWRISAEEGDGTVSPDSDNAPKEHRCF